MCTIGQVKVIIFKLSTTSLPSVLPVLQTIDNWWTGNYVSQTQLNCLIPGTPGVGFNPVTYRSGKDGLEASCHSWGTRVGNAPGRGVGTHS